MNRPTHKFDNLIEKIAEKESRSHKKPGKRTKRWRKWVAAYKPLTTHADPPAAPAAA